MNKEELLNVDRLRIIGSSFWILGAVTIFITAVMTYNMDINE